MQTPWAGFFEACVRRSALLPYCLIARLPCYVPGTWHLGPDTRYRIDAEGRTPSTEARAKPAHGVCKIQDVG
jgi:hypothetical protein